MTIPRIVRHQCNESLKGFDSGVSEVPVELIQQVVNLFRRTTELFEQCAPEFVQNFVRPTREIHSPLGATEERVAQGGWHEHASIENNNRKVRCHRSNWAPLFGQGKIVVRSLGNFFFGDSLNGSFSLLISPLPEFKNVFQIYPPVGPCPVEGEFFIIKESDKKLARNSQEIRSALCGELLHLRDDRHCFTFLHDSKNAKQEAVDGIRNFVSVVIRADQCGSLFPALPICRRAI